MIATPHPPLMTPQDYLVWEVQQPLRYEYIDGQVLAMTGGTLPHNSIALNLAAALKNHLRGKGCKVFMADAKVGISPEGPFHYPDVMVTCDRRDQTARQAVYYPCLIVEVLSPGTEHIDQGKKFRNYRRVDTLREYVLIDAETINVDCYRLNAQGKWELTTYAPDTCSPQADSLESRAPSESLTDPRADNGTQSIPVHFSSVDFTCSTTLLYEDVVFADQPE
jgi:Uma2 family endonuclease